MKLINKKKASLSLVRNINYELIWKFMSENKKSTIPTISEKTGLSLPTVTRAIDFGLEIGMIVTAEMAESARGRKAQLYMLNFNYSHFLLLLLDNNKLVYQVRDLLGGVLKTETLPIVYDKLIDSIQSVFEHCLEKYPKITTAAIAVTGVVNKGVVLDSWTIPNLNGFFLQKHLEEKYGIEVIIVNNVKAATMAAKRYVKNYDEKTIVAFEFGYTGFGAGVLINGEILEGCNGSAGELGDIPLEVDTSDRHALYSKSLQSIVSVINPHAVIFYYIDEKTDDDVYADVDAVIAQVKKGIPEYAFPRIIKTKNFIDDCFYGMNILCIRSLNISLRTRRVV